MDFNIESRFTQKLGCLQGGAICAICGSHFAAAEARIPPLLSSAPNESVLICAICGRLSPAAGSVNSVQSVGGLLFAECILPQISQIYTEVRLSSRGCTLQLRRQDTSATIFRTLTICVNLCNLWEALPSSRFCEFCAICGRTTVCSVGAAETAAPPEIAIRGRPSAGAGCVRSFLRSRGRRRRRIPARYTCVR